MHDGFRQAMTREGPEPFMNMAEPMPCCSAACAADLPPAAAVGWHRAELLSRPWSRPAYGHEVYLSLHPDY